MLLSGPGYSLSILGPTTFMPILITGSKVAANSSSGAGHARQNYVFHS